MKKPMYRVYVMKDGRYFDYFWVDGEEENLARIICRGSWTNSITVTDKFDNFVLNTMGNFMDRCPDEDLRQRLLKVLIPMQQGEVDPYEKEIDFEPSSYRNDYDEMTKEEFSKLMMEFCGYSMTTKDPLEDLV